MKFLKGIFLFLLVVFLMACSKSDEDKSEHFLSSQQKAMEKAEGVEDMLKETEEKRKKQAEEPAN